MRLFRRRDNRVVPVPDPSPSVNPFNPLLPQPRLPTNVDAVTAALREEVSKEKRDTINQMKQLIEPQTTKMKELTDEYNMLKEILDDPHQKPNKHEIYGRRKQIRDEIGGIKMGIIEAHGNIEDRIKTLEREFYRRTKKLPPLPSGDILDADAEMAKVLGVVDDFDLRQGKKAFGAEAVLHVTADDLQRQFDTAMAMSGVSGSPRGSVKTQRSRIDEVVKEVTRGLPRGSSAHGSR